MSDSDTRAGTAASNAPGALDASLDAAMPETWSQLGAGEMACPICGVPMPDLKGGKATICPNCGFKDSCCY